MKDLLQFHKNHLCHQQARRRFTWKLRKPKIEVSTCTPTSKAYNWISIVCLTEDTGLLKHWALCHLEPPHPESSNLTVQSPHSHINSSLLSLPSPEQILYFSAFFFLSSFFFSLQLSRVGQWQFSFDPQHRNQRIRQCRVLDFQLCVFSHSAKCMC